MVEASLLPPENATPFEQAQSDTDAARWPLPTHLVKDVWNPATCPIDLLPYLAAGFGFEVWNDDWTEDKKRDVVANIWKYKRNKTKLKGINGYLGLVDSSVVSAHRPRDKRWWSGGQTPAQRMAVVSAMPRIRIYSAIAPEKALPEKAFWGGRFVRAFWGKQAWAGSDAAARYAGRATYVDGTVTTPVTVRGIDGTILDASLKVELVAASSIAKAFWGTKSLPRFWGHQTWLASDASERILAITPTNNAAVASFAVPSGLVPTTVRPTLVAETVPQRAGQMFWGRSAWGSGGVYLASDAADHVYNEVILFDGSRLGPTRQPYSFWGYSRWGKPPYTAELRIDVTLQRKPAQFGWGKPWGRSFWNRASMQPLWSALEAIRIAQAYRDTIWVDTTIYAPIRFSAGLRFGDLGFEAFGDQRKLT